MRFLTCLLASMLPFALAGPAYSDEGYGKPRRHHHAHERDAYDRHVIEVVHRWGFFVINGAKFTPKDPHCLSWLAGERVKITPDAAHSACVDTVIVNATRRQTCEAWCGGRFLLLGLF